MSFLGNPQDTQDPSVTIGVSNGPIYVSPRSFCGNQTVTFTNATRVSVSRMSPYRTVYVQRGLKYVPTLNAPELTDLDTLTFFFNRPETGYIL